MHRGFYSELEKFNANYFLEISRIYRAGQLPLTYWRIVAVVMHPKAIILEPIKFYMETYPRRRVGSDGSVWTHYRIAYTLPRASRSSNSSPWLSIF